MFCDYVLINLFLWYNLAMKSNEILSHVATKTRTTTVVLAERLGVSPVTAGRVLRGKELYFNNAVRYLNKLGYSLYAAPSNIDVTALVPEAISIEPRIDDKSR